eukprot:3573440-Rhodomonas_salina.1
MLSSPFSPSLPSFPPFFQVSSGPALSLHGGLSPQSIPPSVQSVHQSIPPIPRETDSDSQVPPLSVEKTERKAKDQGRVGSAGRRDGPAGGSEGNGQGGRRGTEGGEREDASTVMPRFGREGGGEGGEILRVAGVVDGERERREEREERKKRREERGERREERGERLGGRRIVKREKKRREEKRKSRTRERAG